MGQLCDAGCIVTFDAKSVAVHRNNELLLDGVRTPDTGLWHLSLVKASLETTAASPATIPPPMLLHQSFAAIQSATPAELVAFAHAALFSPALSTLTTALKRGFLPNFMGLTAKSLRKYPPHSVAMVKGHLDQARKNQRSTKKDLQPSAPALMPDDDVPFPESDPGNLRAHHCYASVFEPATGQIHSDQTGKFVVASSAGNNYVLVVYDYNSNSILLAPMRSRTGPCILEAFKIIHTRLVHAGLRPQLHRLDKVFHCTEKFP